MIKQLAFAIAIATVSLTPGVALAVDQRQDDDEVVPPADDDIYPPDRKALNASGTISECVADAPWVKYVVNPLGFTPDPAVATLTVMDINNKIIEVKKDVPLNGKFLYPGAAVDDKGNASDWPGWDYVNGKWVELGPNEGDTIWRKGINIRFDVNPTTTAGFANPAVATLMMTDIDANPTTMAKVSYPDATPDCPGGPKALDASGTISECVGDAPYVKYFVSPLGFTPNPAVATLTIMDINNKIIEVKKNVPLTGQFLYPGAKVDKDGKASDWPGWDLVDGEWVELGPDEGDTIWRKGINIRIDVNPTTFASVSYPDATPDCPGGPKVAASPPPASQDQQAAAALPRTGSDGTSTFLQIGALLLVAGGLVVVATHRRRSSPAAG